MIDRRSFFRLAAGAGGASLVAACGWDGGNAVRPLLLDVSRINDWVGEKVLFSTRRLAQQYDISQRTTRLPSYFISPTMPELRDPAKWQLRVDGLVRKPQSLSLDDLRELPRTTYTVKHRSEEHTSELQSSVHLVCRL